MTIGRGGRDSTLCSHFLYQRGNSLLDYFVRFFGRTEAAHSGARRPTPMSPTGNASSFCFPRRPRSATSASSASGVDTPPQPPPSLAASSASSSCAAPRDEQKLDEDGVPLTCSDDDLSPVIADCCSTSHSPHSSAEGRSAVGSCGRRSARSHLDRRRSACPKLFPDLGTALGAGRVDGGVALGFFRVPCERHDPQTRESDHNCDESAEERAIAHTDLVADCTDRARSVATRTRAISTRSA